MALCCNQPPSFDLCVHRKSFAFLYVNGTDAIALGDSGGPVYVKSGSNYLLHGIVAAGEKPAENEVASLMYSSPIYFAQDVGFTVKTS